MSVSRQKQAIKVAIIGGGAAGFFAAITMREAHSNASISIHEKGQQFLSKVRISGGGRCNVTHNCMDPRRLSEHYPRGQRELRAAFHTWHAKDTVEWFAAHGVPLHAEADGRMFPQTNHSQSIIDCLLKETQRGGIERLRAQNLRKIEALAGGGFRLHWSQGAAQIVDRVLLACGSLKANTELCDSLQALGHSIEPLAPSLFAFALKDTRLANLAGLSVPMATVKLLPKGLPQSGPLLITHRGLSGPAILRLSAWEARTLQACQYQCKLSINWIGNRKSEQVIDYCRQQRSTQGKKIVKNSPYPSVPKRLWEQLLTAAKIATDTVWSQVTKVQLQTLAQELCQGHYAVQGRIQQKEQVNANLVRSNGLPKVVPSEFVSCGGLARNEINWRTMESKKTPGLYFAGECIDYDGITGGFNFQGAWTTGRLAGLALAQSKRTSIAQA